MNIIYRIIPAATFQHLLAASPIAGRTQDKRRRLHCRDTRHTLFIPVLYAGDIFKLLAVPVVLEWLCITPAPSFDYTGKSLFMTLLTPLQKNTVHHCSCGFHLFTMNCGFLYPILIYSKGFHFYTYGNQ